MCQSVVGDRSLSAVAALGCVVANEVLSGPPRNSSRGPLSLSQSFNLVRVPGTVPVILRIPPQEPQNLPVYDSLQVRRFLVRPQACFEITASCGAPGKKVTGVHRPTGSYAAGGPSALDTDNAGCNVTQCLGMPRSLSPRAHLLPSR